MRDMVNLDVMRSLAVISVVLEHLLLAQGIRRVGPFEVAWVGIPGVLVFFVLTCLVLMWSLERKPHTLDFYIRRVFRIFPLALVALAAVLVFRAPTGGTTDQFFAYNPPTIKSLVAQATMFPGTGESLLTVMWSLPYEMAMYVLLPMVFFYVRKNFSLWPLLVLWGLAVASSRKVDAETTNFAVTIGFFLPGVMAYVGFNRWKPKLPAWMLPAFLLATWISFWYHANFHRGWIFCLVVGLGLPLFRQIRSEVVLAPSRVIARYSYGVYLTHPFAIVIGFYLLRGRPLWMELLAVAVPLAVLPVLAYHLIEHPMIRAGSRLAARAEKRYEQAELKHFRPQQAAEQRPIS